MDNEEFLRMKQFFITFNWAGGTHGNGFGNCSRSPLNGDKFTYKELKDIERDIESIMAYDVKVIILNIVEIAPE